jgi:hypothetical protein
MTANQMKKTTKRSSRRLTATAFEKLPDAEKDRIYDEIDAKAATFFQDAKPLTKWQKDALSKGHKRLGRPRLGADGTRVVSVTIEKGLLIEADKFAKSMGLKRSDLFSRSVSQAKGRVTFCSLTLRQNFADSPAGHPNFFLRFPPSCRKPTRKSGQVNGPPLSPAPHVARRVAKWRVVKRSG